MLTAMEARKLYEGEDIGIDDDHSKFNLLINFILSTVERRAKGGHADHWCSLFISDNMAERIKDQLENLGYIIDDDPSTAAGCFKIYW